MGFKNIDHKKESIQVVNSPMENIKKEIQRIDSEKIIIRNRIEELKSILKKAELLDNKKADGFNLEALEATAMDVDKQLIKNKIRTLEEALELDNYADTKYCEAAKAYAGSIGDKIKVIEEKIIKCNDEVREAKNQFLELDEKKKTEIQGFKNEIDDLLGPLDVTIFSEAANSTYSGEYVIHKTLEKIKKRLN